MIGFFYKPEISFINIKPPKTASQRLSLVTSENVTSAVISTELHQTKLFKDRKWELPQMLYISADQINEENIKVLTRIFQKRKNKINILHINQNFKNISKNEKELLTDLGKG